MKFLVYALQYANSTRLYIGKSSSGLERPRQHSRERILTKTKTPVSYWIRKNKTLTRQSPEIVVLEECKSSSDLSEAERFYIAYFRSIGIRLLNLTDGGEGAAGVKQSEYTKKKRAAALRGRTCSIETRQKLSVASRNYFSDEKARSDAAMYARRRAMTIELKEKISASLRGRCSEVQREALKGARAARAATRNTAIRTIEKNLGIGVCFSRWRAEQKLTLQQAAKFLGTSSSALCRVEQRERIQFPSVRINLSL